MMSRSTASKMPMPMLIVDADVVDADFQEQQQQLRAALITPPLSPNNGQMFSPIATDVAKELEVARTAATVVS
jgi:hypothetical protein